MTHDVKAALADAHETVRILHGQDLSSPWMNWQRTALNMASTLIACVEALKQIADEQKVYKGHGDYDILPALAADEAMMLARKVLSGAILPQREAEDRITYRRSLGLPNLGLDEKTTCRRCGADVERGCEPDGCRDPDCPMLSAASEPQGGPA